METSELIGPLILNPDVELVSVREFPIDVRKRLGGSASDFILSDKTSRIGSQRIEQKAAMFLRHFRKPCKIVKAVYEHSAELNLDPVQVLTDIYPFVSELRLSSILVDPDLEFPSRLGTALSRGQSFEGLQIIEPISALAETDIYKAKTADGEWVAVKYLRSGSDDFVQQNLKREAAMLRHASERQCSFTPRLFRSDLDRSDPYICLEWFPGQTLFALFGAQHVTFEHRILVARHLLDAYESLHQSGVLHGDVHPCNVQVLPDGSVRLIDFGGARLINESDDAPRIGLVHYYEPEVAREVLAGRAPSVPSLIGEQYNVAALLFSLITGSSCIALSLESEAALRQIASQPPRFFEELGINWPSVENALRRALEKESSDRYKSFGKFRVTMHEALATGSPKTKKPTINKGIHQAKVTTKSNDLLKKNIAEFTRFHGLESHMIKSGFQLGPKASLYAGAGGIAYALLRIGCLCENVEALAAADVWITSALTKREESLAFTDGSVGAATETGELALFHSVTGLHVIKALVRYVSGDEVETHQSLNDYQQSIPDSLFDTHSADSLHGSFPLDATNGAASLLLGIALLMPLCLPGDKQNRSKLENLGQKLFSTVQRQFEPTRLYENRFLGFAHGRVGAAYSLLRWLEVTGQSTDPKIIEYLNELARLRHDNSKYGPWSIDTENQESLAWTGWCHGSSGHLLTWCLAAKIFQKAQYLDNALVAGNHIWEAKGHSGPSLCCGAAGESLALFELARTTGDNVWIDRGIRIGNEALKYVDHSNDAQGLFRSGVGICLVAAEMLEPQNSSWPICQSPL